MAASFIYCAITDLQSSSVVYSISVSSNSKQSVCRIEKAQYLNNGRSFVSSIWALKHMKTCMCHLKNVLKILYHETWDNAKMMRNSFTFSRPWHVRFENLSCSEIDGLCHARGSIKHRFGLPFIKANANNCMFSSRWKFLFFMFFCLLLCLGEIFHAGMVLIPDTCFLNCENIEIRKLELISSSWLVHSDLPEIDNRKHMYHTSLKCGCR